MSDLSLMDPISHDAALTGCINACWEEGVVDAQSVVSLGVAMIAWGLSIQERDYGAGVEELREAAIESVDEFEPIHLREAA